MANTSRIPKKHPNVIRFVDVCNMVRRKLSQYDNERFFTAIVTRCADIPEHIMPLTHILPDLRDLPPLSFEELNSFVAAFEALTPAESATPLTEKEASTITKALKETVTQFKRWYTALCTAGLESSWIEPEFDVDSVMLTPYSGRLVSLFHVEVCQVLANIFEEDSYEPTSLVIECEGENGRQQRFLNPTVAIQLRDSLSYTEMIAATTDAIYRRVMTRLSDRMRKIPLSPHLERLREPPPSVSEETISRDCTLSQQAEQRTQADIIPAVTNYLCHLLQLPEYFLLDLLQSLEESCLALSQGLAPSFIDQDELFTALTLPDRIVFRYYFAPESSSIIEKLYGEDYSPVFHDGELDYIYCGLEINNFSSINFPSMFSEIRDCVSECIRAGSRFSTLNPFLHNALPSFCAAYSLLSEFKRKSSYGPSLRVDGLDIPISPAYGLLKQAADSFCSGIAFLRSTMLLLDLKIDADITREPLLAPSQEELQERMTPPGGRTPIVLTSYVKTILDEKRCNFSLGEIFIAGVEDAFTFKNARKVNDGERTENKTWRILRALFSQGDEEGWVRIEEDNPAACFRGRNGTQFWRYVHPRQLDSQKKRTGAGGDGFYRIERTPIANET